jgi:hypothetical protein
LLKKNDRRTRPADGEALHRPDGRLVVSRHYDVALRGERSCGGWADLVSREREVEGRSEEERFTPPTAKPFGPESARAVAAGVHGNSDAANVTAVTKIDRFIALPFRRP